MFNLIILLILLILSKKHVIFYRNKIIWNFSVFSFRLKIFIRFILFKSLFLSYL